MLIVTGGAGFIGSALVWALNARGQTDILIVDRLGEDAKWKNLRQRQFLDVVPPDRFLSDLDQFGKVDAVLHMGAITDTAFRNVDTIVRENAHAASRLAEWSLKQGARFIYASSAAVYGDGSQGFSDCDELTTNLSPLNPYGFSKWLFDMQAIRRGLTSRAAGLRFFNVFGPNEYHKGPMASVVYHSTNQIRETGRVRLFESHRSDYAHGEQMRDFIYVKDICRIVLWLLDNPQVNGIYNCGTGHARSYNDLAKAIFAALDLGPNIEYIPTPEQYRTAYQYFTQADMTRLRAAGYEERMSTLEEAVRDYVGGYLARSTSSVGPAYLPGCASPTK